MMFKYSLLLMTFMAPLCSFAHDYEVVDRPRQECWTEPVSYRSHDNAGALIGGIAGGIIGNQVGRGAGRLAATALGAGTGAIVGDRLSSDRYYGGSTQRCRTVVEQVRVPARTREIVYEDREIVEPYYVPSREVYVEQVGYYPSYYGEGRYHHRHHRHHHYD
jgi:uncharacterized protein YcfJ